MFKLQHDSEGMVSYTDSASTGISLGWK